MMKQYKLKLTTLLFLLTMPFSIYAASLSNGISIASGNIGPINLINAAKGEIVINDMQMLLSKSVKIHSPTKKISSSRELRKGMNIKFNSKIVGKKRMITEVWVLPGN